MNYQVVCNTEITTNAENVAICSSGWVAQVASVPFQISQIDPSVATAMFGAGFALFIPPWAAAYGISKIFQILR